jgi:hypothetical protein
MNKMVLSSRVGPDGVLDLKVPLAPSDANQSVRVTVEPLTDAKDAAKLMSREEWLRFVESTAGTITDPTFERPPQGDFETREALP